LLVSSWRVDRTVRTAILRAHPLLARLDPDQLDQFMNVGESEIYREGERICSEGTLGDALYLILSGTAEVVKGGRRLALLKPGEFFGEMSLVEPLPCSATVQATELLEVFRLPHAATQRILAADPQALTVVLASVVRVLSQRLRRTNELLGSVGLLSEWLKGSLV
jgi:CRP-like cAMP-binding protein